MMNGTQLKRKLGLVDAVFLGLGAILGAGVFVVTGVAAQVAGPAMLIGFLLAGFVALCNALSVAQLAKVYPVSGGTYIYATKQIHPLAGFMAGWMFLTSKLAAAAVVALSFASYVQALFPETSLRCTSLGLVVVLTLLNFWGVKKTSLFNMLIVIFTVSVLTLFGLMGLPRVAFANFAPFTPKGLGGILQATALLFFAYTGYARIATLGEEVEDPETTIPRAILMALGGSSVLYLLVSYALLGTVPAAQLANASPLQAAARQWGISWLELLISLGAITAMVSVHLGQLLGISRMFFAMARDGDLPEVLSRIWAKKDVPHISLLLTGSIVAALVALTEFFSIVSIASFAILVYYGLANASALSLRPEQRLYPKFVSWIGLSSCGVLALSLDKTTILTGFFVLTVGVVYYFIYRRDGEIARRR
jgi:APA family basic amino acid/polyamine antiporter